MKSVLTSALVLTMAAGVANAGLFGEGPATKPAVKHTRAMDYSAPAPTFGGQHFTNGYGCTYSRTQAPGYPVVWILQVNSRQNGCPNEVPG